MLIVNAAAVQLELLLNGKVYPPLCEGVGLFFFKHYTTGLTTDVSLLQQVLLVYCKHAAQHYERVHRELHNVTRCH
jgi:hypothetical protein